MFSVFVKGLQDYLLGIKYSHKRSSFPSSHKFEWDLTTYRDFSEDLSSEFQKLFSTSSIWNGASEGFFWYAPTLWGLSIGGEGNNIPFALHLL